MRKNLLLFLSDRGSRRMPVFDENGKSLDQSPFAAPSSVNFLYISPDRDLWIFDEDTSKVIKFDLDGLLLYSWGSLGDFPGGLFNTHGAGVAQQGNLYIAEAGNGRAQKFRPRPGANPDFPRIERLAAATRRHIARRGFLAECGDVNLRIAAVHYPHLVGRL